MIWQLVILVSCLPVALVVLLRLWFGARVLKSKSHLEIQPDSGKWRRAIGSGEETPATPATAGEAGLALRKAALDEWRRRDAAQAKAWQSARYFGMAVPPLAVVIVILGMVATRVPFKMGAALVCLLLALAVVFNLLHLGAEIRSIARAAASLRKTGAFRRLAEEEAVISCATAHAWNQAVPPILRWLG